MLAEKHVIVLQLTKYVGILFVAVTNIQKVALCAPPNTACSGRLMTSAKMLVFLKMVNCIQ